MGLLNCLKLLREVSNKKEIKQDKELSERILREIEFIKETEKILKWA